MPHIQTQITNLGDKESTTGPGLQLRPDQNVYQMQQKMHRRFRYRTMDGLTVFKGRN